MSAGVYFGDALTVVLAKHCTENPVAHALWRRGEQAQVQWDDGRYVITKPAVPWVTDTEVNYLDLCPTTEMVSFLPAKAECVVVGDGYTTRYDPWDHPKRQTGRIGRVVRKVLTPEGMAKCSGDDIEDFVTRVKAELALIKGTTVDLVSGPDIAHYYGLDGDQTTVGSCMQGQPEHWFDLYALNSKVKMLVAVRPDGMMVGRALVWETDNGGTVVDTVYGDGVARKMIEDEATRRGWGQPNTGMTVSLEHAIHDAYPYVDSFCNLSTGLKKLRVGWAAGYDRELRDTNGGGHYHECTQCGVEVDGDDAFWSDYSGPYCEYCWSEATCQHCNEYIGFRNGDFCESCLDRYVCTDCGEDTHAGTTNGYCDRCLPNHTCTGCEGVWHEDDLTDGVCASCADTLCDTCEEVKDDADEVIALRGTAQGVRYDWSAADYVPYTYTVTIVRCKSCEFSRLTDMVAALAAKEDAAQRADAIVYA